MCFMNCPYENAKGECIIATHYPSDAYCQNGREDIDVDEIPDTDNREDLWIELFDIKNALLNEGE